MAHSKLALRLTVAAAAATLAGAALAAPAQASTRVEYSPTWTVGGGPICGGQITGVAVTHPNSPGTAYIRLDAHLQALPVLSPAWACTVPTTIHWHNRTTGTRGSYSLHLSLSHPPAANRCRDTVHGPYCGTTYEGRLKLGRGVFHSWITTGTARQPLPHLSGSTTINAF